MGHGDVVRLKTELLGNPAGTLGIGFHDYGYLDGQAQFHGCQFIFENGDYDGFDVNEQSDYLEFVTHRNDFYYEFTNVMQLSRDYDARMFDKFLRNTK